MGTWTSETEPSGSWVNESASLPSGSWSDEGCTVVDSSNATVQNSSNADVVLDI